MHIILTDIGIEKYDINILCLFPTTVGENIINAFLSKKSLFTLFAAIVVTAVANSLNAAIYSFIAGLSKYSINKCFEDCKQRVINHALCEKDLNLRRTNTEYWIKKFKKNFNASSLTLSLMFLSVVALRYGYFGYFPVFFFIFSYILLYINIFFIVNKYYIFCLALESIKSKREFIASKQVRELVE